VGGHSGQSIEKVERLDWEVVVGLVLESNTQSEQKARRERENEGWRVGNERARSEGRDRFTLVGSVLSSHPRAQQAVRLRDTVFPFISTQDAVFTQSLLV
jgi:hypothetical protein